MNQGSSAPAYRILAVDDEPDLLDILKTALEGEGMQVHTFSTANEAIDYYEGHANEIDLVLLDYVLPDLTGDLVFECLQRTNPDVRVVLLTACDDQVAKKMFGQGLRGYIQKPFYLDDLIGRIREELAAP
ncbi:response regulator [bacterium]|nr:response regulator [bacterium]